MLDVGEGVGVLPGSELDVLGEGDTRGCLVLDVDGDGDGVGVAERDLEGVGVGEGLRVGVGLTKVDAGPVVFPGDVWPDWT